LLASSHDSLTCSSRGRYRLRRRNSYMASHVPKSLRGRANGLIGGCARVASMLGPALGGVAVHSGGDDSVVFAAQALVGAATVALLIVGVPRSASTPSDRHARHAIVTRAEEAALPEGDSVTRADGEVSGRGEDGTAGRCDGGRWRCRCAWADRAILLPLLAAGPIGFSFSFVRGARSLLIPLKADSLELSASAVGYVTAASFACDSLLFPLGGHISDKFGRKAAGVPSLLIMAASCVLLALARGLWGVTVASALLGVGNALSSGIVQTVGQDAAPSDPLARSQFLGLYKVATDSGTFLGPLAVGLVANAAGLDAAAMVIAGATSVCALWYAGMSREAPARGPSMLPPKAKHSEEHESVIELIVPQTEACQRALGLGSSPGATA
jgi:MFS family permease